MIVIYTSPGCASCRKVKTWLKEHNLEFIEKNIFTTLLNPNEIKHLFMRSENGTDDLISKRSKIIVENKVDVETMSMNELVDFIVQNPSVLKRPIIISERIFQVGYDQEEIDAFIPAKLRKLRISDCDINCPNYPDCGQLREDSKEGNA